MNEPQKIFTLEELTKILPMSHKIYVTGDRHLDSELSHLLVSYKHFATLMAARILPGEALTGIWTCADCRGVILDNNSATVGADRIIRCGFCSNDKESPKVSGESNK